MRSVRQEIGGLGNLMFKQAYLWAQMRDGQIPDVYLQSEKYFAPYRNEVRQMFGQGIVHRSIPKVALHIRRGDYLKASEFHVNLWQTDYYKQAIELFPDEEFLVFCKDRQNTEIDRADHAWCVENLLPLLKGRGKMYDPATATETDDLNAMASCKSLIGANSTFSWWAAYLGGHEKVVMPKQWFTDGVIRCDLLDEWTQL